MTTFARLSYATLIGVFSASGMADAIRLPAPESMQQSDTVSSTAANASRPNPDALGKYHVGDGVSTPAPINMAQPELPKQFARQHIYSSCVVSFTLSPDGNPKDVHTLSSIPSADDPKMRRFALALADSCVEAMRQYRFEPAKYQDRPVPVELTVGITLPM